MEDLDLKKKKRIRSGGRLNEGSIMRASRLQ